jgi:ferritin-like metal-binding protein YciE
MTTQLATLDDRFRSDLAAMYSVETELLEALGDLADDTRNEKLQQGFAEHRAETREHVDRLEALFTAFGQDPESRESPTFERLQAEGPQFDRATTDRKLRDLFDREAGIETERLERAGYQGLLVLANKLNYDDDVTDPLEDTLSAEKATLRKLEGMAQGSTVKSLMGELLA